MAITDALRRFIRPETGEHPRAPYLSHYQVVAADGEVYREADVPVVYFESAPAMAKATLLSRAEPERGWRVVPSQR